ncbi:MAG: replication-associated recombination protein A [Bacteroidetes bacterium]|nr:replication-associated recombination protein A [Bacteroidota bacterium]
MELHSQAPLAERMRPKKLSDYIGQPELLGPNGRLRHLIEQGKAPSMILWGPPGTGKTTLAEIIADAMNLEVRKLSAISSGVADLRKVFEETRMLGRIVLFIDEIHRFNKSQQDALLGAVEKGRILLIGATTENPSFEVNQALLSRCQVYVLQSFTKEELNTILQQAVGKDEILKTKSITLQETDALIYHSGGDARKLLNLLELVVMSAPSETILIDNAITGKVLQQKLAHYDKSGEQHYDIVSAFIKSMRGSDPNAALYWMARMLDGGEDVKFIARRMIILASEDIGNANPNALLLATSCFQAVSMIGMPEARIILSQTASYLASSPKSNRAYEAIEFALEQVRKHGDLPVPLHLRNAPTKLMKELDYGKNYQYDHHAEMGFAGQEFLPEALSGTRIYDPGNNPREEELRRFLKARWQDKYGY